MADELQITITEAFEIFVDRGAQKRSKTKSETAVVNAFLPKLGARCPLPDTEADALLLFQNDPLMMLSRVHNILRGVKNQCMHYYVTKKFLTYDIPGPLVIHV